VLQTIVSATATLNIPKAGLKLELSLFAHSPYAVRFCVSDALSPYNRNEKTSPIFKITLSKHCVRDDCDCISHLGERVD
jgi:hypothetical protein